MNNGKTKKMRCRSCDRVFAYAASLNTGDSVQCAHCREPQPVTTPFWSFWDVYCFPTANIVFRTLFYGVCGVFIVGWVLLKFAFGLYANFTFGRVCYSGAAAVGDLLHGRRPRWRW